MSRAPLDEAKAAVAAATKRGAQGVRARVVRARTSRVEWRDGKLDRMRESTKLVLTVELYVDGRYSSNTTSDLRPDAVGAFLDEAVAMSRVLAKDEHRRLPDLARCGGRHEGDLGIYDPAGAPEMAERRRVARDVHDAARAAPGHEKIISVTGICSDSVKDGALVTSSGVEGTRQSTDYWLAATVSVKGEGDRKPVAWDWAGCVQRARLPALEAVAGEATRRAVQEIGARREESLRTGCVIENRVVSRLLRGLQVAMSGDAIQQKRSFLADRLGQAVASPSFDVADDPLLAGGLGSRTYDGEGMTAVRRPLLEKGVLRSFFLDTYYANKLGKEPTTAGTSNLVFTPGSRDLAGLLAGMGQGILVTGFSGGNSNPATGDFSVGIRGLRIEGGKVARPVVEMNLAGNHLRFWKRLVEVGSDPFPYATTRSPSLRFEDVQFSGA